eukprot:1082928-Prymnesium_polylepis.2
MMPRSSFSLSAVAGFGCDGTSALSGPLRPNGESDIALCASLLRLLRAESATEDSSDVGPSL